MSDVILASIGFAAFGFGIIDVVQSHSERKYGWALLYRGQIALGAILIGAALT